MKNKNINESVENKVVTLEVTQGFLERFLTENQNDIKEVKTAIQEINKTLSRFANLEEGLAANKKQMEHIEEENHALSRRVSTIEEGVETRKKLDTAIKLALVAFTFNVLFLLVSTIAKFYFKI